ncbi:glycosyltransferase involved in cell wall biosynthesis [Salinibacter ruber]|uniref:glycosyltransferase family 4 protein n=1 Tax=Salinibacter ruber TaxID=146919 RepID=UPI002169D364|nr:glycosyltransferase family 4 protein [Salinibacter ruber]MCS4194428.1 glycosyltransferase involved in cell wall biosynthesis [Salinibacter ruber]
MRILTISNTPHDPSQGSGYVITGFAEGLRECGHTVDAYGPDDWAWTDIQRGRRYLFPIMIATFAFWHCRPENYDLVELWGGPTWLLAICLQWLYPKLSLVHHSNGIEQHRVVVQQETPVAGVQNERWFQRDFSWLYDRGLHAADAIVTVSTYDVPFLIDREFVPRERVYTIENPLPDFFLGQTVQYERPKRIGFCGNWIPIKNTQLLRDDVPSFLRQYPDWTFSVVGIGDTDVKADFPDDVHSQIEVIPFLERKELVDWYHSLAIFTLPSIYESFGMVMTEAMACGATLVATRVGFASGLSHGDNAYLLTEKKSSHLERALTALTDNDERRRRIARRGYERVQELRWDDAVSSLEEIYTRLL